MKTLFTLAALAAATLAAPVVAQDLPQTQSRAVRVADLDLNNPAHVERLDWRIGRAARAMCHVPSAFDPSARSRQRDCVARATADAAAQRNRAVAAATATPDTRTASR